MQQGDAMLLLSPRSMPTFAVRGEPPVKVVSGEKSEGSSTIAFPKTLSANLTAPSSFSLAVSLRVLFSV